MSEPLPTTCNPHPDAPHGFDRNGSHAEDRYVCDCESWTPPPGNLRDRIQAIVLAHGTCECGESADTCSEHAYHLADTVIEALNLSTPVEYLSVDGKRQNFMVAGHYTMEVADE